MLPGRPRRNARGRSRVGWLLLLAAEVSCGPPGRGGPTPQATSGVAIRINQLGYRPEAPKRAVVCALEPRVSATFVVVDERNRTVFGPSDAEAAGPFGPCAATFRLDFSTLRREGVYRIEALGARSLPVRIADDVYRGAADSLLAYLREQRSGYNPVFRDSVHQGSDGVLVDHPTRSGEFIPGSGGWADASDYLQHGARDHHVAARIPRSSRGVRRPVSGEWSSRGERRPRRAGRGALGARLAAQDVSGRRPAAQSAGGRPRPRPLGPSCQRFVRLWVGAGSAAPGVPLHREAAGTVRKQEPLHGPRVHGGEIRGRVRAGRRAVPRARQRARPPSRRARAGGIRARRRASRRMPDGARPLALLLRGGQLGGRHGARRRGALWAGRRADLFRRRARVRCAGTGDSVDGARHGAPLPVVSLAQQRPL